MASPIATELGGWAGYDVLMLDHEHSPADVMNAFHCMNAARGTGAEVWVRIPGNDADYVKKILDCGADGIMCPMVNTADDAARLVAACRYPPHGIRGFAPTLTRHTCFGFRREEYFRRVDEDLLIMAQIESREAVDNAEAIAAVEALHMLFIGPMDLSKSLGHTNEMSHPVVAEAIRHIEAAIRKNGKLMGTLLMPGGDLGALIDRGYTFILLGSDVGLLRTAMQSQVDGARRAAAARATASG
jgi:4-hydroxy-2-oxoheptanedioate aldolase